MISILSVNQSYLKYPYILAVADCRRVLKLREDREEESSRFSKSNVCVR
jgi:hypothetical protein